MSTERKSSKETEKQTDNVSRREFMKTGTAAAGAAKADVVKNIFPVGVGAVRDLIGTRTVSRADKALLASKSGFSSPARKLSISEGIYPWDMDSILNFDEELEKLR